MKLKNEEEAGLTLKDIIAFIIALLSTQLLPLILIIVIVIFFTVIIFQLT